MKSHKTFCTLITPFFNEEEDIENFLETCVKYVKNNDFITRIILIDDGSNDTSRKKVKMFLLRNKDFSNIFDLIVNQRNIGWQKSFQESIQRTKTEYLMTVPVGSVDINTFLVRPEEENDIVIYERLNLYTRGKLREILSVFFRFIITIFFHTGFVDTNAPILIKTNKLKNMNFFSKSFFFQVEIVVKFFLNKYSFKKKKVKLQTTKSKKSQSLNYQQLNLVIFDFFKLLKYYIIYKIKF